MYKIDVGTDIFLAVAMASLDLLPLGRPKDLYKATIFWYAFTFYLMTALMLDSIFNLSHSITNLFRSL
jgi:hypothetical protein